MKTVAIIEGFAGGPYHTKLFRKSLRRAGYQVIRNRRSADIIVAHSAGIYAVPMNARAELIVLIGPTYWPGRQLAQRVMHFTTQQRKDYVSKYGWKFYLSRRLWGIYYILARNKYMWLGIINNNRLNRIEQLAESSPHQIILVRNQDESFTDPNFKSIFKHPNVKHVELPGIHDQYTVDPLPYIKLIGDYTK